MMGKGEDKQSSQSLTIAILPTWTILISTVLAHDIFQCSIRSDLRQNGFPPITLSSKFPHPQVFAIAHWGVHMDPGREALHV